MQVIPDVSFNMFNLVFGVILLLSGSFFVIGGVFDSDLVFKNGRGATLAQVVGRKASRVVLGGLGGLAALGGIGLLLSSLA